MVQKITSLNFRFRLVAAIIMVFILSTSCSTKKNTWSRRTYHNLTSQYNVYWNGNESLKTGVSELRKNAVDDYSKVLRVFHYGSKADAQRQYPAMDRAIQKASIGVQRHSMVFGGREQVRWIDDSYLLMGKAYYFKQDFISARRTFEFVSRNYSYNSISHTADLWLARTYVELGQFEKAIGLLNALNARKSIQVLPREVNEYLPLVFAHYHISMGRYAQALPYLKQGINTSRDRLTTTRLMFISGQIYDLTGELSKSLEMYQQVIRRNPPYEMAFEARINLATAYDENAGDSRQIVKVLKKMLRDEKNTDFQDKIYYALAKVAEKDKNDTLAMNYLAKSVQMSVKNNTQKATSALKLANMYFDRFVYVPSQAYYDTAVQVLPSDYPGFDSIKQRATVLGNLVQNLSIIQEQDSLLRLAVMDSVSLYRIIDGLIADHQKKEEEKIENEARQEMMRQSGSFGDQRGGDRGGGGQSAEWYFYNPNTLSFGYSEFLRKWGRRRLEDNWRISDKRSISFDEGMTAVLVQDKEKDPASGSDSTKMNLTPLSRGFYLANIPFEEEQKQLSNDLVMESLNSVGYIYKEDLKDNARARESYKKLNERYPGNPHAVNSWYALYKIAQAKQDNEEAEYYKNLIINNFPDSDYARIIIDPDFYKKSGALRQEAMEFYEQTLLAYRNEQYFRVLMNANRARELYSEDTSLMPRFDFMRAISIGKIEVLDSMAVALNELVLKYQLSPVTPLAVDILRKLSSQYQVRVEIPEELRNPAIDQPKSPYVYDANGQHMVMIISQANNVKTDPLKVRISDFNTRFFSLGKLTIKSLMLDNSRSLITVGNFASAAEATDYYETLVGNEYVFGNIKPVDYNVFPVSMANYPVFYREKDVEQYRNFWVSSYPK